MRPVREQLPTDEIQMVERFTVAACFVMSETFHVSEVGCSEVIAPLKEGLTKV